MLAVSAVVLILAVAARQTLPDGKLHVYFLDVGPGEAIFIQTPSGRQALVDGGPSPSLLFEQLGRRMPFWDHSLDLLVLSHPDDDVLPGPLAALERYRVDGVIARDVSCRSAWCRRWQEALAASGAVRWRGEAGLRVTLDRGLTLTVLHPGPALLHGGVDYNENSLVLRLDYGGVCFLLTGDVGERVEQQLVEQGAWLDCTILKAAHHGDVAATTEGFLAAVDPEAVVISVGAENRPGRFCAEAVSAALLTRLEGRAVYRTDEDGTVEVVSDGRRYWVETER